MCDDNSLTISLCVLLFELATSLFCLFNNPLTTFLGFSFNLLRSAQANCDFRCIDLSERTPVKIGFSLPVQPPQFSQ